MSRLLLRGAAPTRAAKAKEAAREYFILTGFDGSRVFLGSKKMILNRREWKIVDRLAMKFKMQLKD